MIIQQEHYHFSQEDPAEQQQQDEESILTLFQTILENTKASLNEKTIKQTQRLRRYYEQKVYLSFSHDPNQYLMHMLHKSESQSNDQVAELVMGRQNKVITAIKNEKYDVKMNNEGEKIKKIKDELSHKISEMKNNFIKLQNHEKSNQDSEQAYRGFMQFRKKGYWNQQSDQGKKVKSFMKKIKKQKQKMQQEHEKNRKIQQQQEKQEMEKIKKQQEKEEKKAQEEAIKKREKVKEGRMKSVDQHKKKIQEINGFLDKYKTDKPIFISIQQKFKKEFLDPIQQQKKRKLNEIKKSRKPLDHDQLQLHSQRYQEFRQKFLDVQQRKDQDAQLFEKNMQKLKQLYHSHFHEQVEEQMNNYQNMLEEKRKFRERINSYSNGIKDEFKPIVDNRKRKQLQNMIKVLEIKQNGRGKKIVKQSDGSVTFEEFSPDEQRKLGISYLEQLKKYNQGKKRKQPQDRSSSMMDLSKKKIIYPDYLKDMRGKSRIESATTKSRNGWRKIISQQGFSNRDKYNSVMDHVSLLEHEAKQKQLQLKYMKNGTKALELKQKLDKYYLESVAAKMHVLKDVILKD